MYVLKVELILKAFDHYSSRDLIPFEFMVNQGDIARCSQNKIARPRAEMILYIATTSTPYPTFQLQADTRTGPDNGIWALFLVR
jgi:hypothetical protein